MCRTKLKCSSFLPGKNMQFAREGSICNYSLSPNPACIHTSCIHGYVYFLHVRSARRSQLSRAHIGLETREKNGRWERRPQCQRPDDAGQPKKIRNIINGPYATGTTQIRKTRKIINGRESQHLREQASGSASRWTLQWKLH